MVADLAGTTSSTTTLGSTEHHPFTTPFERRFRAPLSVFMRVYEVVENEPGFKQSSNATGQAQAHPFQEVVAALRGIAYREAHDRADKYVPLSRSAIANCAKRLMEFIVRRFGPLYVRDSTDKEVRANLARNAEPGMPGCLWSFDY